MRAPDVLVIGEVLVEVSTRTPWADGAATRLGFSGDALNVAAASAAAGARTALLAKIPQDELGDAMVARIADLGVEVDRLVRAPGQHGVYLSHTDPLGAREFSYARAGSLGATLAPQDLDERLLREVGVVVTGGVTGAISATAREVVLRAALTAQRFVYDPNYRPALTSAATAGKLLRTVAATAALITPSWPGETSALLGLDPGLAAEDAALAVAGLGSADVVLTCGPSGAVVVQGAHVQSVPGLRVEQVVDQTGAGDCVTGTLAARLSHGDSLVEAARLGVAAAALSVGGQGGTGHIPTLSQTRAAARRAAGHQDDVHPEGDNR